ncbi:MAG: UDP-N-acetylglucosamine 2-epimerase (hydrolyzing) [Alphaproteobacteria bacterium]|nr:UDP-N-acetylglucosamine 2-epimerase (hydrolyzing) [Alphaproteobacteria bacterium]
MASILEAAGQLALRLKPDRAVVIGDRLDMFPATLGLVPLNVPIVHLHGGELTYGALDDRIRHSITKLAHLHCAATVEAATRIAGMGEEPWRITVTGAPGLDTLIALPVLDQDVFSQEVGLPSVAGLRLVTVHPETNATEPLAALDAVLAALSATPGPSLITAPNADPGSMEARHRIDDFVAGDDNVVFHEALGARLYPSALRHASVMVGNSSSGIIEAGLFGLPVVNVGGRQDGRERGANVIECAATASAVVEKLGNVLPRSAPSCPYGNGASAPRVAASITGTYDPAQLLYKRFAAADAAGGVEFHTPW